MKKYSGALGMLILALISAAVVGFNYKGLNYTISNHSAENMASIICFCIFGTIATLFIAYNLLFYIPKKWDVGEAYKIPAGLFSASFVVTCSYPNNPGVVTPHDIGSWGIIFSGFILMVFLTLKLWRQYNASLKTTSVLFILISLGLAYIALFHNDFLWRYILIFEPGMIAMFFLLQLCLIFDVPKEVAKKKWTMPIEFRGHPKRITKTH